MCREIVLWDFDFSVRKRAMKGPVLMREYCSISTFPMPQTTDSAKNRKPVAAKGASKRPCLSEGEVERRGGGREVLWAIFLLELDWSPSSPAGYSHVKGSCFR